MSVLELSTLATVAALAGVQLFVSIVDVPTLNQQAARDPWAAKRFFGVWWPTAARVVPSLLIGSVALSSAAFYRTGNKSWIGVALLTGGTLPFTAIFLGGRIKQLLKPSEDESKAEAAVVKEQIQTFGARHHPRTLFALGAVALSVSALVMK